jgi:hypothetical protein
MTTPTPDTGTGTPPATGGTPSEPTPTDQQPTAPDTDAPDWQAEAEKWKTLARKHETTAKANKQLLDKASAATAGEPTVDDLKAQLAELSQAHNAAEERNAELAYSGTVRTLAQAAGADPEALLDSDSFRDAVASELGEDFDDDDLSKAVTKVAKVFAAKPRFAATSGTAPARSGADITGGTPPPGRERPRSLSEAVRSRLGGGKT